MTAAGKNEASGRLARRPFREGVTLPIIGFGGIMLSDMDQEHANRLVSWALERGVDYFDVGPTYPMHKIGYCERLLGVALEGRRETVFLSCKTTRRDAGNAAREFQESLDRLRTDHFDLYLFHGVPDMAQAEAIVRDGGAAEPLLKEKERGRCRYLGLSAHSEEAALFLMEALPLDAIMFPVNYACMANRGFGAAALQRAREKNIGRVGLKAIAHRPHEPHEPWKYPFCWYVAHDTPETARGPLFFALSQDIASTISPGDEGLFRMCVELAMDFRPMSRQEQTLLMAGVTERPIFL